MRLEGSPAFLTGSVGVPPDPGYHVRWDWNGREVRVTSQPFGFAPLFILATPTEFLVSPHIATVLARSQARSFDTDAIAAFLRLGFFLGQDTPWREIRALPASGQCLWRPGESPSWGQSPRSVPGPVMTREEALHTYGELFRRSVAARLQHAGRIGLPLSGGRDSRHILFEMITQGRPPDYCITARHFPDRSNEDLRIAQLLCDTFNCPHVVVDQPLWTGQNDRQRLIRTNFCADEHTWTIPVVSAIRAQRTDYVFDGIGGDVLSAGLFLDEPILQACSAGETVRAAQMICQSWGPNDAQLQAWGVNVQAHGLDDDAAVRRVARELDQHQDSHNPLTAFYFWNRTRREISEYTFSLLSAAAAPVAPFLDPDLMQFLLGLPAEFMLDKRFHDDALATSYPAWQAFPFEDKSAPSPRGLRVEAHYAIRALEGAMDRYAQGPGTLANTGQMRLEFAKKGLRRQSWEKEWLARFGPRLQWLKTLDQVGPAGLPAWAAAIAG